MCSLLKSISLVAISCLLMGWGFFGHENINRIAIYTLPPEMIRFYKKNQHYIVEASVNPDRRRYAIPEEGPRHYIDIDDYHGEIDSIPKYWHDAVEKLSEDSLAAHGVVPWHAYRMFLQLREAFMIGDPRRILRISSELGHYVADAHVPLHTSSNHNGQKTNQHGIHGLWESRLPELFINQYDLFTGKAQYVDDVQSAMWQVIRQSHACVDSVLFLEDQITKTEATSKYSFETRGKQTVKVYSKRFSRLYHDALRGMVERRLRASIQMVGNLWYTAWLDAGQPDLNKLVDYTPTVEELELKKKEIAEWKERRVAARHHEEDDN